MDYLICKEFGWTLDEIYSLPQTKYEELVAIMSIEKHFQGREAKKLRNLPNAVEKYPKKYKKKI